LLSDLSLTFPVLVCQSVKAARYSHASGPRNVPADIE